MTDLEKRLDAVCESLESQRQEFEEACHLVVEAINNMSQRVERIEKWMLNKERRKQQLALVRTTNEKKK
ncbi:hypothetical protein [Legionella micdadei]|uniref:Uncharacterized protein n=1 Tax=Legionella micdadei TaxID=451 RepID=A0A098GEQ9_LEGMI|nr:hypothetical protein [Legionella micdadei]KTD27557.1 hypothetical protein Lmic_1877 [Legionella micdadei]CEG60954.1 protein of unknown function [Legionella micdadei]SCY69458.1 hypothetical protein SAMN02982997_02525 [Legionella micdadei]